MTEIGAIYQDYKRCIKYMNKMACYEDLTKKYDVSIATLSSKIPAYESALIDNNNTDIKVEQDKLRELHRKIQKDDQSQVRFDLLVDNLKNSIDTLPYPIIQPIINSTPALPMVLVFGDQHYGMTADIRLDNKVLNVYNSTIFCDRMRCMMEELIAHHPTHITIINLGDSIHNALHISALRTIDQDVSDQLINYSRYMATWINQLSGYMTVDYYSISGNHDDIRLFEQKGMGSYGRLMHEFIKQSIGNNDRVTLHYAPSETLVTVGDCKILANHYGTNNMDALYNNMSNYSGESINIVLAAHMHHARSKTVSMIGEVVMCPSFCGVDDYAQRLHKSSPAGAILFDIHNIYRKNIHNIYFNRI